MVQRSVQVRSIATSSAVALGVVVTLAGCGLTESSSGGNSSGATVSISHAQGETQVPKAPKRIVVLDLAVLDSVDYLGGTVVGLPKRGLPNSLEKYKAHSFTDVGTMQEPDVEKVAALEPDVILIGGRSAAKYEELTKIAPTVDLTVDGKRFLESFREQATTLGTILDKQDQVAAKLAEIDTAAKAVNAKAATAGDALVLMTSGGKVSAFGASSRFGLIHNELGVKTAVNNLSTDRHGQAVSFEFIGKAAPDHLFVIDRDVAVGQSGKAAKEVLNNPLVTATPAWKNNKVTYLDGSRWYLLGSGLTNLPAMIKEVDTALSGGQSRS